MRKKQWEIWARSQNKTVWRKWLVELGLSDKGPWTAEQVYELWALLFRRLEVADKARVSALIALIEDDVLYYADSEELIHLLDDLHRASIGNRDFGNHLLSSAALARQAIHEICRALIGPGGHPKKDESEKRERLLSDERKAREALFVLEADREARRRRGKGEEITTREVIMERLDASGEVLQIDDIERETKRRRREGEKVTFEKVKEDRLSVHPFWHGIVTLAQLMEGVADTRTFTSSTRKAIDLENTWRSFVRVNNTQAKIRAALGLRKRRNKKRTSNPPAR